MSWMGSMPQQQSMKQLSVFWSLKERGRALNCHEFCVLSRTSAAMWPVVVATTLFLLASWRIFFGHHSKSRWKSSAFPFK